MSIQLLEYPIPLLCTCTSQKPSHGDISGTESGIIDIMKLNILIVSNSVFIKILWQKIIPRAKLQDRGTLLQIMFPEIQPKAQHKLSIK